jgi:hypothetical protein
VSSRVSLRRLPTPQISPWSMRTCQFHGPLVAHSGKCDAFFNVLLSLTVACFSPMIGGSLSHPADQFPDTFGNSEFLKKYPYFLACAVPATFSVLAWVVTFVFLREVRVKVFFFWTSTHRLLFRPFLLRQLFAVFGRKGHSPRLWTYLNQTTPISRILFAG